MNSNGTFLTFGIQHSVVIENIIGRRMLLQVKILNGSISDDLSGRFELLSLSGCWEVRDCVIRKRWSYFIIMNSERKCDKIGTSG